MAQKDAASIRAKASQFNIRCSLINIQTSKNLNRLDRNIEALKTKKTAVN
jgi:hypothetical protein